MKFFIDTANLEEINKAIKLGVIDGVTYISPFVGRIDDIGYNNMDLIKEIITILDNYNLDSEIITASIRHSNHVKEAA